MVNLKWTSHPPAPNPFEAVAGDDTEYQLHEATSDAGDDAALRAALPEVVDKALSFAEGNLTSWTTRLLLLWDQVYCQFTVVYVDDAMARDARDVVQCRFEALDEKMQEFDSDDEDADTDDAEWEAATAELSERVKAILQADLSQRDLSMLPAGMTIHYSDVDRATCDEGKFEAQRLVRG